MNSEPIVLVSPEEVTRVRRGRRRRKVLLATGSVIAILGAGLWWPRGVDIPTAVVQRGDIVHSLVAVGRLEARQVVEVIPRITGRIRTVEVREGDPVEPGQVLATLDDVNLQVQVREAIYARNAAQARWEEIDRGTRREEIEEARNRLQAAEQLIVEAEARLEKANAEAEYARLQEERFRRMSDGGVEPLQRADETRHRHRSAQAEVRGARAATEVAKARRDEAKTLLTRLENGATKEERRRVEAEFQRATEGVARLEEELAQTKLVSPLQGIVTRRYKEPSELAYPGMPSPILVLADREERIARVEVLETDLYKISAGQRVRLTSDAYPGRSWEGRIAKISPAMGRKRLFSENPKEKTDVKVLEVEIALAKELDLPLNLPVEARLEEKVRSGVLILPLETVDAHGTVCGREGTRRRVRLGMRDEAFVEIVSGVAEGERVLLRP